MVRKTGILFAAAIAVLAPGTADATVIYLQNFGWTGGGTELTSVDWTVLSSLNGASVSDDQPSPHYVGVRDFTGHPTDASNVNAGASESDVTGAVRFFTADFQVFQTLAYTEQYVVDRSAWEVDSISFYAARTSGPGRIRAAIRIDDTWYVGEEKIPPTLTPNEDSAFADSAGLIEIDFNAENWYQLTAVVGENFAIDGTPVSLLPSGNIDAFGAFAVPASTNGHRVSIDTYSITATAVPEPNAAVLFFLFLVGGGCALHRFRGFQRRSE